MDLYSTKTKVFFYEKHVVKQARKALFGLYMKIRRLDLSIECQLKLIDNLLALTYGCEVWSFGDLSVLKRFTQIFLNKFLKYNKAHHM